MKKSTILVLLLIYIVSFFVVGLIGVSIRSNYQVSYVSEILITPLEGQVINEMEPGHTTKEISNPEDPDHIRYEHSYNYETDYEPNLIVKFKVQVKPDNTTYNTFETIYSKSSLYLITVNEDNTVFIAVYDSYTNIELTFQSSDGNRLQTTLRLMVF